MLRSRSIPARPVASIAVVTVSLAVAACTGGGESASGADAARHGEAHAVELVPVPTVPADRRDVNEPVATAVAEPEHTSSKQTSSKRTSSKQAPSDGFAARGAIAVIGEHGHLGSLTDSSVDDVWPKWRARPSLDGTTAVMTLQEPIATTVHPAVTAVSWVSLPDGVETDELLLEGVAVGLDAVSADGDLAAFTNFAEPVRPGEIAGAKVSTTLLVVDRDGIRYETRLDGNFVVEAFGRQVGRDGLPDQLFLLEHVPADAPRFYRVRVLDPATGEVSLPLNIRDKSQQVDERMSGLSRSQVVADEHGLLFTLYRGTIDGTPDGEPYAFVHTLDLANGVWCLFLDPELELDTQPGSIAVGGDRLYVAGANGKVGAIDIPSISDIAEPPEMDWVVRAGPAGDEPPTLLADADGVWVGLHDGERRLVRLDAEGFAERPLRVPGASPTALAYDPAGAVVAAGDGWSTVGPPGLPDWFGAPTAVYPG